MDSITTLRNAITAIADAIREKTGSSDQIKLLDMLNQLA